jgi:hypothetical protein
MKGNSETSKCYRLVETDPKAIEPCLDQAPPPASFLPNDRQKDETISEYLDRKQDEWGEPDCFYKGLMDARYIGESQRIEDQCKRDLEIKRLRKAVEKLNKQNPR